MITKLQSRKMKGLEDMEISVKVKLKEKDLKLQELMLILAILATLQEVQAL